MWFTAALSIVQGVMGQQKAAEQAQAAAELEAHKEQQQVYLMAAGIVGLGLLAVMLKRR
jgi:hypothetical protein